LNFTCQFCKKSYTKESTLLSHLCEPKRRHNQQNEQGVQIGFNAYLRFYEKTQGSAKFKAYSDFCNSNFYIAFVRYGRYLVDLRAINVVSFTDWLLSNNHKLDHWTKEKLYNTWLLEYLKREPAQDAMERALKEMQEYADSNEKLENNFNNYFKLGAFNLICHHISTGRISPWVIYNCDSGIRWLNDINQEQLNIIMPCIDPDHWSKRFKDFVADAEWCKLILKEAGL
jgi:hypothetical protein